MQRLQRHVACYPEFFSCLFTTLPPGVFTGGTGPKRKGAILDGKEAIHHRLPYFMTHHSYAESSTGRFCGGRRRLPRPACPGITHSSFLALFQMSHHRSFHRFRRDRPGRHSWLSLQRRFRPLRRLLEPPPPPPHRPQRRLHLPSPNNPSLRSAIHQGYSFSHGSFDVRTVAYRVPAVI